MIMILQLILILTLSLSQKTAGFQTHEPALSRNEAVVTKLLSGESSDRRQLSMSDESKEPMEGLIDANEYDQSDEPKLHLVKAIELSLDASEVVLDVGEEKFNEMFTACPVVAFHRNGVLHSIYRRLSGVPSTFNAYRSFTQSWTSEENIMHQDFEIYDDFTDAVHKHSEKSWDHCSFYEEEGIGYPGDCGKDHLSHEEWFTMPGSHQQVAPGITNGISFSFFELCPIFRTEPAVIISTDGTEIIQDIEEEEFNRVFNICPVVGYFRNGELASVYLRKSEIPEEFNPYLAFTNTWTSFHNKLHEDFELYSSFRDMFNKENEWNYCAYDQENVGFPNNCGPKHEYINMWFRLPEQIVEEENVLINKAPGIYNGAALTLFFGNCPAHYINGDRRQLFSGIVDAFGDAFEAIHEVASDTFSTIGGAIVDVADWTVEAVKNAADWTLEKAGEFWEAGVGALGDIANVAIAIAAEGFKALMDTPFGDIVEWVGKAIVNFACDPDHCLLDINAKGCMPQDSECIIIYGGACLAIDHSVGESWSYELERAGSHGGVHYNAAVQIEGGAWASITAAPVLTLDLDKHPKFKVEIEPPMMQLDAKVRFAFQAGVEATVDNKLIKLAPARTILRKVFMAGVIPVVISVRAQPIAYVTAKGSLSFDGEVMYSAKGTLTLGAAPWIQLNLATFGISHNFDSLDPPSLDITDGFTFNLEGEANIELEVNAGVRLSFAIYDSVETALFTSVVGTLKADGHVYANGHADWSSASAVAGASFEGEICVHGEIDGDFGWVRHRRRHLSEVDQFSKPQAYEEVYEVEENYGSIMRDEPRLYDRRELATFDLITALENTCNEVIEAFNCGFINIFTELVPVCSIATDILGAIGFLNAIPVPSLDFIDFPTIELPELCIDLPSGSTEVEFSTAAEAGLELTQDSGTASFVLASTALELNAGGNSMITDIGQAQFNKKFAECPMVLYYRNGALYAVYKRHTPIPASFNAYLNFIQDWRVTAGNQHKIDFDIYSSVNNMIDDKDPWSYCNGNSLGVGFPRDCGPTGHTISKWFATPGYIYSTAPGITSGATLKLFDVCPTSFIIPAVDAYFSLAERSDYPASNCIDRNLNTMCHEGHAGGSLTIRIPLSKVSKIKIINRDSFQYRLENARVSVDGIKCGYASSDAVVVVHCENLVGSLISIDGSNNDQHLNLMEVQVYGEQVETKTIDSCEDMCKREYPEKAKFCYGTYVHHGKFYGGCFFKGSRQECDNNCNAAGYGPIEDNQACKYGCAMRLASQLDQTVKINFQPSSVIAPKNYLVDSGNAFGVRSTFGLQQLSYGWECDHSQNTRDLNGVDTRDSTLIMPENHQTCPNDKWKIAVPNGKYDVKLGYPETSGNFQVALEVEQGADVNVWKYTGAGWSDNSRPERFPAYETTLSAGDMFRLEMIRNDVVVGSITGVLDSAFDGKTFKEIFQSDTFYATQVPREQWYNVMGEGVAGLQPHCALQGFNLKSAAPARYSRLGFVMNEQNDCSSPDAGIGVGFGASHMANGAVCHCCESSFTYNEQPITSGSCTSVYAGFRLSMKKQKRENNPLELALEVAEGADSNIWKYYGAGWSDNSRPERFPAYEAELTAGDEFKLEMIRGNVVVGSVSGTFDSAYNGKTLKQIFQSDTYYATDVPREDWYNVMGKGVAGLQPHCAAQGFNLKSKPGLQHRWSRLGFMMNEQDHCLSPDASIGIGMSNDVGYDDVTAGSACYCCDSDFTYNGHDFTSGSCDKKTAGFRLSIRRQSNFYYPKELALEVPEGADANVWKYHGVGWSDASRSERRPAYDSTISIGDKFKLEMIQSNVVVGSVTGSFGSAFDGLTFKQIFQSDTFYPTHISRREWYDIMGDGVAGLQPNCNVQGFNLKNGGVKYKYTRLGFVMNNENDCNTPDSAIGVGFAYPDAFTAGSICTCCPQHVTYQGETISSGSCTSRASGFRLYLIKRTTPVYETQSCKIQETYAGAGMLSNSEADAVLNTVDVNDGQLAITGSWNEDSDSKCDALSYVEITKQGHNAEYYYVGDGHDNGCAWSSLFGSAYGGYTAQSCRDGCDRDFRCTGYKYRQGWCDFNSLDMTNCPRVEGKCDDPDASCMYARGSYVVTVNTGCTNSHVITLEDPQLLWLTCPETVDKTNWATKGEDHTGDRFKIEQSEATMKITRTDSATPWCMSLKVQCYHSSSYKIAPTGAHFHKDLVDPLYPATNCIDGIVDKDSSWTTMCHSSHEDQLYIDIPYSRVSKVKVMNRIDCCRDRQIGIIVSVSGVVCGIIDNEYIANVIHCPHVPGNQVMLSQPAHDQPINLQEVVVFGTQVRRN